MNQIQTIEQSIQSIKPKFEENLKAIGISTVKFNQEASFAIEAVKSNSYLARMPLDTIVQAVLNVSLTGLSLNPIKKTAYLVPRKGKCVLEPSYRGLRKILEDCGVVKNMDSGIVYEGEPFEIIRGTSPKITHGIATSTPGRIVGAYSVANLADGTQSIEWMYEDELVLIMNRSTAHNSGKGSPWTTDPGEMRRKTVLKRHTKQLPMPDNAIAALNAIELDHEVNGIDFEVEQRQASRAMSIDVVVGADIEKMSSMIDWLETKSNAPDSWFPQGYTREVFCRDFREKLLSGTLNKEYAESVYNSAMNLL